MTRKQTPVPQNEIKPVMAATIVRFKGDGSAFVPGIPTRDLTAEEWAAIPESVRLVGIKTELYIADPVIPQESE